MMTRPVRQKANGAGFCSASLSSLWLVPCLVFCLALVAPAAADENLALYGLKGWLYTFSPLVVDGGHVQAGAMYSSYENNSLNCREGHIWAMPVSVVFGDGDWWEAGAAVHWEYYKNTDDYYDGTDVDRDRSALGDVFLGGKIRLLSQDREGAANVLDLSLMPYVLLPTGERDQGIADLYRFIQSDDDRPAWGLNLLLGRRFDRLYLALNLGINYMDADPDYIEDDAWFLGLTTEYQVREDLAVYAEFVNIDNKNRFNCAECSPCYDEDGDEDIREIGIGAAYLKDFWGFKLHTGVGLGDTSPDFRVVGLVNYNIFR